MTNPSGKFSKLCVFAGALLAVSCSTPQQSGPTQSPVVDPSASGVFQISNDFLVVEFSATGEETDWTLSITDTRTGRVWTGGHTGDRYRDPHFIEGARTNDSTIELVIRHPQRPILFESTISIENDAHVTFHIESRTPDEELEPFHFPPRMETDLEDGALLFADRSPGILLPQTVHHYENRILQTYGNVSALDLPWIGILDRTEGDGMMILFDTPENSGVFKSVADDDLIWPRVAWLPSMAVFEYPRTARFVFFDEGGHVGMARYYREIAREKGKIVPLAERISERPKVAWLLGAPYIWGRSDEDFARELHSHGIRRAVIKGRASADQMNLMTELGFLTSEYDSYTDIQQGEPGPQTDDIETTAVRLPDGSPMRGWQTHHGIQYYVRSHYFARNRAELYVPPILERHPFTARFIDVSGSIQPFEDWAPDRMFGARQDLEFRRDLFRYFTEDLGLVLGAEHAKGWTMPLIDYSEGNMSASFWWESERPGQLLPFLSLEEMSDHYLEIGMNMQWRVPLWDLVYHDTVVSTWYWGDSNGYLYNILPEMSDLKDALNILHGTPAMVWANHLCYGWDRNRHRFLETYRLTGRWHERVGFDELLGHEFLSDDRYLQRTTFSSGAVVHANLGTEPRAIQIDGEEWTLPRYGFHARAGDFVQWRSLKDGVRETVVLDGDYASIETEQPATFGPFEGSGLIDLFKIEDGRWHILSRGEWSIKPAELPAFDPTLPFALVRIDDQGNPLQEIGRHDPADSVRLPATDTPTLYAVLLGIDSNTPLMMPQSGKLRPGQAVAITAGPNTVIRYSVDGSDVTADSPIYSEPIGFEETTTLRARAFRDGQPVGETSEGRFVPVRVLFQSDVKRTHDPASEVQLDITGARTIRILVDDSGDGLDFDSAAIGEARVVDAQGRTTMLKDLPIIRYSETDSRDHSIDAHDISIGGRGMTTAIRSHAFADFIFELDRRYQTFEAFLGIPDDTEGMGSIRFTIEAEH